MIYWVVVLGDFGRSPRMQYHALSLSRLAPAAQVHVVAYGGSAPLQQLLTADNVHIHCLPEPPRGVRPRLLLMVVKVLQQLAALLWLMLVALPRPCAILMQNPPAIPTMLLCWLAARWHRAAWVVDWHNYAHTIMSLSMGRRHPLVRIATAYEHFWGRRADDGFCVTAAMQADLRHGWGVRARVLHDRPPSHFRPATLEQKHELFSKLRPALADWQGQDWLNQSLIQEQEQEEETGAAGLRATEVTVLTHRDAAGRVSELPGRPAVLVSSTSWTPDEDFGILLDAAVRYDELAEGCSSSSSSSGGGGSSGSGSGSSRRRKQEDGGSTSAAATAGSGQLLPRLLLLITGKGPQKEMYLERIARLRLRHVSFRCLWLEADDYPVLLGCADLGVCLHTSSSGLDLPMKVLDMFGAGLPVVAASYSCITELVEPGATGMLFEGPRQLADHLVALLRGFAPGGSSGGSGGGGSAVLDRLRDGVHQKQRLRWEENWAAVAAPLFSSAGLAGDSSSSSLTASEADPPAAVQEAATAGTKRARRKSVRR